MLNYVLVAVLVNLEEDYLKKNVSRYFRTFRNLLNESDREFLEHMSAINQKKREIVLVKLEVYSLESERRSMPRASRLPQTHVLKRRGRSDFVEDYMTHKDLRETDIDRISGRIRDCQERLAKLRVDLEQSVRHFTEYYQRTSISQGYYRALYCSEIFRNNKRCDLFFSISVKNISSLTREIVKNFRHVKRVREEVSETRKKVGRGNLQLQLVRDQKTTLFNDADFVQFLIRHYNMKMQNFNRSFDDPVNAQFLEQYAIFKENQLRKHSSRLDGLLSAISGCHLKKEKYQFFLLCLFIELISYYEQVLSERRVDGARLGRPQGKLADFLSISRHFISRVVSNSLGRLKRRVLSYFEQGQEVPEALESSSYAKHFEFNFLEQLESVDFVRMRNRPKVGLLGHYKRQELEEDISRSVTVLLESGLEDVALYCLKLLLSNKHIKFIKKISAPVAKLLVARVSQFDLEKISCDYLLSLVQSPENFEIYANFLFCFFQVRL